MKRLTIHCHSLCSSSLSYDSRSPCFFLISRFDRPSWNRASDFNRFLRKKKRKSSHSKGEAYIYFSFLILFNFSLLFIISFLSFSKFFLSRFYNLIGRSSIQFPLFFITFLLDIELSYFPVNASIFLFLSLFSLSFFFICSFI